MNSYRFYSLHLSLFIIYHLYINYRASVKAKIRKKNVINVCH